MSYVQRNVASLRGVLYGKKSRTVPSFHGRSRCNSGSEHCNNFNDGRHWCVPTRRICVDASSFGMPLPEALAAGGPVEKVVCRYAFPHHLGCSSRSRSCACGRCYAGIGSNTWLSRIFWVAFIRSCVSAAIMLELAR